MNTYCQLSKIANDTELNVSRLTVSSDKTYVTFDTGIRVKIRGTMRNRQTASQQQYNFVGISIQQNYPCWQEALLNNKEKIVERIARHLGDPTSITDIPVPTKGDTKKGSINALTQYTKVKDTIRQKAKGGMIEEAAHCIETVSTFDWKEQKQYLQGYARLDLKDEQSHIFSYTITAPDEDSEKKRIDQLIEKDQQKKKKTTRTQYESVEFSVLVSKDDLSSQGQIAEGLTKDQIVKTYTKYRKECEKIIESEEIELVKKYDLFETECQKYYGLTGVINALEIVGCGDLRQYIVEIENIRLELKMVIKTSGCAVEGAYIQFEKVPLTSYRLLLQYIAQRKSQQGRMPRGCSVLRIQHDFDDEKPTKVKSKYDDGDEEQKQGSDEEQDHKTSSEEDTD